MKSVTGFVHSGEEVDKGPFHTGHVVSAATLLGISAALPQSGPLLITVFGKWTDSYIYPHPRVGKCLFAWVFDSWLIKLGDSE